MSECRSQKYAPGQHDVKKPDDQTRYRPDGGEPDHGRFFEEQTEREDEVTEVAHPEHVAEFVGEPVVNSLGNKEQERQHAEQLHSSSRGKNHSVASIRGLFSLRKYHCLQKNLQSS